MSRVKCHMSRVTCHVSPVIFFSFLLFLFFRKSGEVYRWRVCFLLTTVISDIYTTETTIFLEKNISWDGTFKLLKFLLRSKLILFPQPSLDVLTTVLPRYTDNSLYDTDGGSVECHQYWPAYDSTLFYGDISVTCTCEVSTAGAKYNLATQISFLKINKNLNDLVLFFL